MIKKLQALRAKKGFTLVELIVVIAIIGILAAILIPMMMGYVQSANITSADQNAASLKQQLSVVFSDLETKGCTIVKSTFGDGNMGGDFTGSVDFMIKEGQDEGKFFVTLTGAEVKGTNPSTGEAWQKTDVTDAIAENFLTNLGDMAAGSGKVFLNKGNQPVQAVWSSDAGTIAKITKPIQKWDKGEIGLIDGVIVGTNDKINAELDS